MVPVCGVTVEVPKDNAVVTADPIKLNGSVRKRVDTEDSDGGSDIQDHFDPNILHISCLRSE